MSKRALICVAGGTGTRMNTGLPKQFLLIDGLPVIFHSIRRFYKFDSSILIYVAIPAAYHNNWKELCEQFHFTISHQLVEGGATRFLSVKNSLAFVPDDGIVAVHDGVRPLVSQPTIQRVFLEAEKNGNAIPVVPVSESVRGISGKENKSVDRSGLRIVQTPQAFRVRELKAAYFTVKDTQFTDDASVLESTGAKLNLVEGNPENIKITFPHDLLFAEAVLKNSPAD